MARRYPRAHADPHAGPQPGARGGDREADPATHGYEAWKRTDVGRARETDGWRRVAQAEQDAVSGRGADAGTPHRAMHDARGQHGLRPSRPADSHGVRGPSPGGEPRQWQGRPAYSGYDARGRLQESGYAEHGRHAPAPDAQQGTRPQGPAHPEADRNRARAAADHRGRGPRSYVRSDDRIAEQVHERLTDDPMLDARGIEIAVQGGVVHLRGQVEARWQKYRAETLAADCLGVRDVRNELTVQGRGDSAYGFQDRRGRVD